MAHKVKSILALEGIWHDPYGLDGLYNIQPTERSPRDPSEGEVVWINCTTWPIESNQSVQIIFHINGGSEKSSYASWKYNSGNNSYWQGAIGPFNAGDNVDYQIVAEENGVQKFCGPFYFETAKVSVLGSFSSIYLKDSGRIVFGNTSNPKLCVSFKTDKIVHFQVTYDNMTDMLDSGVSYLLTENETSYIVSTNQVSVTLTKAANAQITVTDADNKIIWQQNGFQYYKTSSNILKWTLEIEHPGDVFGFGEKYNRLDQNGEIIDIYCYNQYKNQNTRTYLPVPFYYSTQGYGLFINSTYYSRFDMMNNRVETLSDGLSELSDYYVITGVNQKEIISNYTLITGRPQELPVWALGLWMSANEWDRESDVVTVLDNVKKYDLPATVLVLEQWSDEATFYIWNESTYTAVSGDKALTYSDFSFGTKWPSPKTMVNNIHNANIHLILWQVPILKSMDNPPEQNNNDEQYMSSAGFSLKLNNGDDYRIPRNDWFGNSLLLDFSNNNAISWWMMKREYLFDEIGIDGIKPDGGEMVWGRTARDSQNHSGLYLRNLYPKEYIKGYNEFVKSKTGEAITFSRSGTFGSQRTGIYWSGDQSSDFSSFSDALRAGLTAGLSGIPFWSWDLAGFTGDFPTADLYKRCTQMAAFCPIMQFHSEKSDPSPSEERSPWNVALRTGDQKVITTFQYYANLRANLSPYIFDLMHEATISGLPMMRAMILEYPEYPAYLDVYDQYMLGADILVSPVIAENQTVKMINYPNGEWYDFWNNAITCGGKILPYYIDDETMPIHIRPLSILPLNLNADYAIGGSIGNSLEVYTNRVIRIYPDGYSNIWSKSYYDIDRTEHTLTVNDETVLGNGTITVKDNYPVDTYVTYQLYCSKPGRVECGGVLEAVLNVEELKNVVTGYCYNMQLKLLTAKVGKEMLDFGLEVFDVYKIPYDAEFADYINIQMASDHKDYYGFGFLAGFTDQNARITFCVYAPESKNYTIGIRYSAAVETATRGLVVNGGRQNDVVFAKTDSWDSWLISQFSVPLTSGPNEITFFNSSTSIVGMNLDSLFIMQQQ